jgi:PRP1 splicing factor, N-terminal
MQAAAHKQEQDAAEAAANQPFDHFMGNDTGAFAYGDYDQDDREADETYAKIDDIMDERRKVRNQHAPAELILLQSVVRDHAKHAQRMPQRHGARHDIDRCSRA